MTYRIASLSKAAPTASNAPLNRPPTTRNPDPSNLDQGVESVSHRRTQRWHKPTRHDPPPPLELPTRQPGQSKPVYWFKIGRSYAKFYWVGCKATWANHRRARVLKRTRQAMMDVNARAGASGAVLAAFQDASAAEAAVKRQEKPVVLPEGPEPPLAHDAAVQKRLQLPRSLPTLCAQLVRLGKLDRAEYQILTRDKHDMGKLPLFGFLVLILGEYLPLFVPFMPGVVPRTCRIPKQVQSMREAGEKRRREAFRLGTQSPTFEQLDKRRGDVQIILKDSPARASQEAEKRTPVPDPMLSRTYVGALLSLLTPAQTLHMSTALGTHRRLWDRIGLKPYGLMRRGVAKRLHYLAIDDTLLIRQGGVERLTEQEVEIACEERGIDVVGKPTHVLKRELGAWLDGVEKDEGAGRSVVEMLFKR
ncbi:hypothetical protein H2203_005490 [Taxawa tesnikishii (nom. ined.)]|nr:hypothetical protein H2203_005490 [Dothideales sp. JES 119]